MASENTGYKAYAKLLKVTDDGTDRPLDINNNLCSESGLPQALKDNIESDPDYVPPVLDEIMCPIPAPSGYCFVWSAQNEENIKMSLSGYIDFSAMIPGKVIDGSASGGVVSGYYIAGDPTTLIPASIPLTFAAKRANFNSTSLPAITDTVLTSIVIQAEIFTSPYSEISVPPTRLDGAVTGSGQMNSAYNSCS